MLTIKSNSTIDPTQLLKILELCNKDLRTVIMCFFALVPEAMTIVKKITLCIDVADCQSCFLYFNNTNAINLTTTYVGDNLKKMVQHLISYDIVTDQSTSMFIGLRQKE